MGQLGAAIDDYSSALGFDPKLASALYGRGLAKLKQGDKAGSDTDISAATTIQAGIGNSGDARLAEEAERLLHDESPLVRGAAIWALSQLLSREKFFALASKAVGAEADASVREEWRLAS